MGIFSSIGDAISSAVDTVSDIGSSIGRGISNFSSKAGSFLDVVDPLLGVADRRIDFKAVAGAATTALGIYTLNPGLIAAGAGTLFGTEATVGRGISQTAQPSINISIDLTSTLQKVQDELIQNVQEFTAELENILTATLVAQTTDSFEAFNAFAQRVFSESFTLGLSAIVATAEVEQALFERMRQFIDDAGIEQSKLGELIGDKLEDLARVVSTRIAGFIDSAASGIESIITRALGIHDTIQQEARDLLEAQAGTAASLATAVTEAAEGIQATVSAQKDALMGALEEHVGKPLGALGEQVWESATGLLGGVADDDDGALERGITAAAAGNLCGSDLTGDLAQLADRFLPQNKIVRWALNLLIAAFTWMSVFGGITSAQAQTVLQEYGQRCAYKVLAPPDAILARFRGQITQEEMITTIRKDGFSESDAQNMWISSLQVPNELDLLGMWLRGIVTEQEFRDAMQHRGWDPGWTTRMMMSARLLPPVQDLIQMAVREAFTPEAVIEFGLNEDFPEEFAFWSEQQGVSRDWAEKYWAAHWGLPSVQMGYEMLHRDVIDERQLKALMKALDIVPAWRENLIAISFNPYTRVDIRRMHKLGILTETEVKRAYLDLGYDDEKASNLTRFTLELNKPGPSQDTKTLEDLTRSSIIGFFKDGVLNRREATDLMLRAGFTAPVVDLFIDSAELDIERDERHAERDLIIEQAKAGILSFEEAQDRLGTIGLETLEQTKAVNQLVRAQASATRLPTKADLAKFLSASIIDQAGYIDGMRRLGFSELWAQRFHALVGGAA